MAKRSDITPELCRQLLRYERETGRLFWKERPVEMFPDIRAANSWNTRYAGTEAFTGLSHRRLDHYSGTIFNIHFPAHRVVWAIVHGEWPQDQIDHIDGNGMNNRIENLRDVPNKINLRNCWRADNNTSGVTGVSWNTLRKKWEAYIKVDGLRCGLGLWDTKAEAKAARFAAQKILGFSDRHGVKRPSGASLQQR